MIKTKSIFDSPNESDGVRLLIARWISPKIRSLRVDEHFLNLAPSDVLLRDYRGWEGRKPISWREYKRRFLEEMKSPLSVHRIHEIAVQSMRGAVFTLLCWEQEGNPHCHRHIVKRLIEAEEQRLKKKTVRV